MGNSIVKALLALLLFSAASAEEVSTVIEGTVQAAGPSIYMEGSHELVNSQGELLARLSGRQFEVDLDCYKGKKVRLTGEWRPTVEAGGQIFEVRSVALPTDLPQAP